MIDKPSTLTARAADDAVIAVLDLPARILPHMRALCAWARAMLAVIALLALLLLAFAPPRAAAASRPGCVPLAFEQLIERPVGAAGLRFPARLQDLVGQEVCMQGFMVVREQPWRGRFLLTAQPLRMSEHADGEADDLPPDAVMVLLPPAQQLDLPVPRAGLVEVRGRFELGREEQNDGRVTWLRLRIQSPVPAAQTELSEAPLHLHH